MDVPDVMLVVVNGAPESMLQLYQVQDVFCAVPTIFDLIIL